MRTILLSLLLSLVMVWSGCVSKSTNPVKITLSAADQRLSDSLSTAFYNYRYTDMTKALAVLRQRKDLEKEYNPQFSQVHYYASMVHFFAEVGKTDSARIYADSQWLLLKSGKLMAGNLKAHVYATKAYYFTGREMWDSAIANNLKALEFLQSSPDPKLLLNISDALSLAYIQQKNYKMAVHYYLPYIEDLKHSDNAAMNFDVMLNIFAMAYDSGDDSLKRVGRQYLFAAKRLADSVHLDNAQPALDYNLANYYFKEHNTDSGLYYSHRVIATLQAGGEQMDNQVQMAYGQIVQYFIEQKQYPAAMTAFKEMQQEVDTTTFAKADMSWYWKLAYELESHLGNDKSTLYALTQWKRVNDEVLKEEKNDLLLKYEEHMKQLENENFVRAKEYEAKNQRYYIVFVTIIAIMLFAGSIYLFFYWKKKRLLENRYWKQLQVQREVEHRNQLLEERSRISREMHDDLGTTLTSTLMAVEMVEMFPDQKEHLGMVRHSANNLHQQVNEIIWNLNTQNDNVRSLNNYMIRFARKFLEQANIRLLTEELVDNQDKAIPAFQRRMISLSFKELVNNIVKHAQATEVMVYIKTNGDNYRLSVEDNGVGMGTAALKEEVPYGSSGYGLANISRNISRLFGHVDWKPSAMGGTRVDIDINILTT